MCILPDIPYSAQLASLQSKSSVGTPTPLATPCPAQWREKQAQHELAAAMLAVANAKHAVWRFASSTSAGGGVTALELTKLLRHQRLSVRSHGSIPPASGCRSPSLTNLGPSHLCRRGVPVIEVMCLSASCPCRVTSSSAPARAAAESPPAAPARWWMHGRLRNGRSPDWPQNLRQVGAFLPLPCPACCTVHSSMRPACAGSVSNQCDPLRQPHKKS